MKLNRRKFLKWSAILGSGAASGLGYARYLEPAWYNIKTYHLRNAQLNGKFSRPINIVIFADPHFGCPAVGLKQGVNIVSAVNDLEPDLILGVGDYLNTVDQDSVRPEFWSARKWHEGRFNGDYIVPEEIVPVLSEFSAKSGVYTVFGNHDYYHHHERLKTAFEYAGISVLQNQTTTVLIDNQEIQIAGIDDSSVYRSDILGTFNQLSPDIPTIGITHNPLLFPKIRDNTVGITPIFTAAGHTHGGQGHLFRYYPNLPDEVNRDYVYGYVEEQGQRLIISAGMGTSGLPMRLFRRPEIVQVIIEPEVY